MDELIHIRSRGSFTVIKVQAPIIWQEFPFKTIQLPYAAAVLKWRLIFRRAGKVGISDHSGKSKPFSSNCLVIENKQA